MRHLWLANIKTGIKGLRVAHLTGRQALLPIAMILITLTTGGLNFVYGQITGGADRSGGTPGGGMTTGGMPDRRDLTGGIPGNPLPGVQDGTGFSNGATGTTPPNPLQIPGANQDSQPAPYGPGMGQQNPRDTRDAADYQPTLGGGQLPGLTTPGRQDDSEYLKSVQSPSHPLNDFIAVISRTPGDAVAEKQVYLYEVLSGVTSPSHRRELIKAYWNLSEKMMQCHVRLAQRQWLQFAQNTLQAEQLPTDEIELALQLVTQQYLALEAEFIQAQYRFLDLQSKIPTFSANRWRSSYGNEEILDCECETPYENNSTLHTPHSTLYTQNSQLASEVRPLPIPADFPLAVQYNTKFEELKKTRTLSQRSLLLNNTIPLQYKAIVARTAARQTAKIRWQTVLTKNKQAPVAQLEALAQEEMALISTIIEYNHQVDEYVIETFGTNIPEKQLLAAILVLPKRPPTETRQTPNRMPSTYISE